MGHRTTPRVHLQVRPTDSANESRVVRQSQQVQIVQQLDRTLSSRPKIVVSNVGDMPQWWHGA